MASTPADRLATMDTPSPKPPTNASLPGCLANGDVFRTLGLPDQFIIGLDAMAMTTSRSLSGFCDIPPGAHLLWVQHPDGVSRCGYWFVTGTQGRVRAKEWDGYNEVLREPSQSEALQKHSAESTSLVLQPYPLHAHRDNPSTPLNNTLPSWARSPSTLWNTLASAISDDSLSRITGKRDVSEYLVDSMDSVRHTHRGELTFLFTQDFRDLQVLDLSASLRSHVIDTSARIQALLSNNNHPSSSSSPAPSSSSEQDILAEFQLTFLTGTHLGSPACLDQWWDLVLKIILRAHTLPVSHPRLARGLLQTLHAQLFYNETHVGSGSGSGFTDTAAQADADSDADDHYQHPSGGGGGGDHAVADGPSRDRPIFQYKPQNRQKLRQALVEYKRQLDDLLQRLGLGSSSSSSSTATTTTPEQGAVGQAFEELEAWLWRRGWDLRRGDLSRRLGRDKRDGDVQVQMPDSDDEDEDEQPVVVELDKEGREVGLVSFKD
ncbi:hypothetical protein N658DRAFT_491565 [Parathielavia hyrcaniae]|uniref:Uncharacterized protein n=1 Tax=Parathielavia hyrcaniae TaxID=113614 RepID=A0AAN6QB29_9PEZI|nr:hypothetical protein N658DRAFT_491565 [Parathielavia hyrcaniae]